MSDVLPITNTHTRQPANLPIQREETHLLPSFQGFLPPLVIYAPDILSSQPVIPGPALHAGFQLYSTLLVLGWPVEIKEASRPDPKDRALLV